MITKIRSFEHETFFFGGGKGDFTVIILYSDVNNRSELNYVVYLARYEGKLRAYSLFELISF